MKILICTGYHADKTIQSLLDAGAHGYIQKPYRAELLGREIRRLLS